MKTFDVITFGSATRDIFLKAQQFLIGDCKIDEIKTRILLPYGLKINIEDIHFHSGGGGTNAAATFSAQGLKTACCTVLGLDPEGDQIMKELVKKKIDTQFVARTSKKPTNLSIIFSNPKERTILVYRGASKEMKKKNIPWKKIKRTKWFYLAPFTSGTEKIFAEILSFAQKNEIKVMVNPGSPLLDMPLAEISLLLQKADILFMNQEEAQALMKNDKLAGENLLLKVRGIFHGIIIITNGSEEALIIEKDKIYSVLPLQSETVDKTGAGDAFGSGFLAGYIRSGGDMIYSIQLAMANAVSCFSKWGAKEGLLKKTKSFKKAEITVKEAF